MRLACPMVGFLLLVLGCCETLYEVLDVPISATDFEIKKAFRKMSLKFHPDRSPGNQENSKRYIQINRAYEVLSDQTKRVTYDNFGESGLFDLQNKAKPKGGDYRTTIDVTLEDLYVGARKVFSFRRGQLCRTCKGTGNENTKNENAKSAPNKCSLCKGEGKIHRTVMVKGQSKNLAVKCSKCEGKGQVESHGRVCNVCQGRKITIQPRDLQVQIQPGRELWQTIFFKGESEQGVQFYPGDVILTLNMMPHRRFRRQHSHLYTNLQISLQEAILGFDKAIKHLDGNNVMVSSDGSVSDKDQIVVVGKGMPISSDPGKFGNLYVTVSVVSKLQFNIEQMSLINRIYSNESDSSHDDLPGEL